MEPIRVWYQRTTRKAIRSLWWATGVSLIGAALFYEFVPSAVHLKLQIFNGALTIPVAAGIWIASFILVWLVPMRESAFRSQEAMERMERRAEELNDKALQTIGKVDSAVTRIDEAFKDGFLEKIEGHMAAIRRRIERDTEPVPINRRPVGPLIPPGPDDKVYARK